MAASQDFILANPDVNKSSLSLFLEINNPFLKKIYLFIYKYTVAVFRHTRRGHRIPLQMVVSHHVLAGN